MPASFQSLWENRPLRNLAVLALATVIAVIAAAIAVVTDRSSVEARFAPHPLFAGLDTQLDQVDRIVYTSSKGMGGVSRVVMLRNPDGVWGAEERGGYPVDPDLVKKALLGLGDMEAYEPRTANPDWHRNLGLLPPEDIGSAVRVEFFRGDERMAGLLVGKVPERAVDVQGEGLIYVRRDGEDQSWLARGRLPLLKTVAEWLDPAFVDIPREDLARVTLWGGTDNPVVIERASKDESDFSIVNIPAGRVTRGAPVVNGVATAFIGKSFDDVAPADTLDLPENAPTVFFDTFDGMRLTMSMGGQGGALWAKFVAQVDPELAAEGADADAAAARAARLNARLGAWVYKLPQDIGGQFTQTMDLLTREAGPADL
ncbi:MAG: DUF4340 domain-containing protein [Parvibaculum sp.]|uniref:DUF4340 domain-containing protein n=1 Tax=Parvibaculum sp. TaxID=2024848 RepID=UPI0034A09A9A